MASLVLVSPPLPLAKKSVSLSNDRNTVRRRCRVERTVLSVKAKEEIKKGADATTVNIPKPRKGLASLAVDLLEKAVVFLKHGGGRNDHRNYYLSGNYAPVKEETPPCAGLPVHGSLPECLNGIFMRVGPNPKFLPVANYMWKQQYVYGSVGNTKIKGIIKFDLHKVFDAGKEKLEVGGNIQGIFELGPGRYGSEAIFVPCQPGITCEEDDGYLVLFVHDENTRKSELNVIDAKTMSSEPVAVVELPSRVPYGFHALFLNED